MLFGVFGIAPVITHLRRPADCADGVGFLTGGVVAYFIAQATVGRRLNEEPDS